MKIIKRNGAEVPFDITKIITAVTKASDSVGGKARLSREQITDIAAALTDQCQALNRAVSVEEVQQLKEGENITLFNGEVIRGSSMYIPDVDKLSNEVIRINRFVEVAPPSLDELLKGNHLVF